jgi:septum formation protein
VRATLPTLILASASPRRRELLSYLTTNFECISTDGEEHTTPLPQAVLEALPPVPLPLETHPSQLAWRKVNAACADAPESVIIGVDTIVVLDGDVLGKPRDTAHAQAMLTRLSGRTHTVYTGLAVFQKLSEARQSLDDPHNIAALHQGQLQLALESTQVAIAELTASEIANYVATGEPLDKAGSYGIQGLGGRLVREVIGSYTCVVGMPLVMVHRMLTAAGVRGLADPHEAYQRWLSDQGKEPLPCPPTFP